MLLWAGRDSVEVETGEFTGLDDSQLPGQVNISSTSGDLHFVTLFTSSFLVLEALLETSESLEEVAATLLLVELEVFSCIDISSSGSLTIGSCANVLSTACCEIQVKQT